MMMRLTTKQTTLLVLALLIAATPFFFPSAYYFRVGSLLFVNGVAVVGIVILTGFAGQISLGHAGFAGIGAYASALAPVHLGLHPAFAAILGAVLSASIAYVVGRPILRLKGYYLAVASLGFGILVSMVLSNEAWLTGGPDGIAVADLGLRQVLKTVGLDLSAPQFWYFFCGLCLLIGAWLALNLYDSPTGRALRALHGSEIAASTVGVDVPRLKLQAFVISAVYASASGSLLALQNKFITPDVAGYMHSIEMVTMAVLGGAGSVLGAILGAGILTLLPQVLTVFAEYEQVMLGLVMMLVMIFLREGLLPSLLRQFTGRGA
ncbi:MAG TPA: branched-chain amino acid ABC transporter permease [Rhizobium sp.]|nr:branched-chain amino acid ABC transporter permease [Rhizobium sp.]